VEAEQGDFLLARDPSDVAIQGLDLGLGCGEAVVPGQEVGDRDLEAEALAAVHHVAQILRGGLEPGCGLRRPVLVLAPLVQAGADRLAQLGVRVPERGTGGD